MLVLDSLREQVSRGILPVKTISDTFNEDKPENARFTYKHMGRKLKSLGFAKGKTDDGNSAILWDAEKFVLIFSSYGLGETPVTAETAVTPVETSPDAPGVSGVTGVTGVTPGACQEKKSSLFSKAGPAPPGAVLRPWDSERQRQATAEVRRLIGLKLSDKVRRLRCGSSRRQAHSMRWKYEPRR